MAGPGYDALRVERARQLEAVGDVDAYDRGRRAGPRIHLGQVYTATTIPTTCGVIYLTHPVRLDGPEVEGGAATIVADGDNSVPVVVLCSAAPVVGDVLIAHSVGGRWVADHGGVPMLKTPQCCTQCGQPCVGPCGPSMNLPSTITLVDVNGSWPATWNATAGKWIALPVVKVLHADLRPPPPTNCVDQGQKQIQYQLDMVCKPDRSGFTITRTWGIRFVRHADGSTSCCAADLEGIPNNLLVSYGVPLPPGNPQFCPFREAVDFTVNNCTSVSLAGTLAPLDGERSPWTLDVGVQWQGQAATGKRQVCCMPCDLPKANLTLTYPLGGGATKQITLIYQKNGGVYGSDAFLGYDNLQGGYWALTCGCVGSPMFPPPPGGNTLCLSPPNINGWPNCELPLVFTPAPGFPFINDYTCKPFHFHIYAPENANNVDCFNFWGDFYIDGPSNAPEDGSCCCQGCAACPDGNSPKTLIVVDANGSWPIVWGSLGRWQSTGTLPTQVVAHKAFGGSGPCNPALGPGPIQYLYYAVCDATNQQIVLTRGYNLVFWDANGVCCSSNNTLVYCDVTVGAQCYAESACKFNIAGKDCFNLNVAGTMTRTTTPPVSWLVDPVAAAVTLKSQPFEDRACCTPCDIPKKNLTITWSSVAGTGSATLVWNGSSFNATCLAYPGGHSWSFVFGCMGGAMAFVWSYFSNSDCTGASHGLSVQPLVDYTCIPFHVHYSVPCNSTNAELCWALTGIPPGPGSPPQVDIYIDE